MPVTTMSQIETIAKACAEQGATWEELAGRLTALGIDSADAYNYADQFLTGTLKVSRNAGGGANVYYYPQQVIEHYDEVFSNIAGNSNLATVQRGTANIPVNATVSQSTGKAVFSTTPKTGFFTPNAVYTLVSVGQAIGATSAGIWLGKNIDGLLYNANPDYWDSIGLSTLNPETWNTITNGSDSPFAGLFNYILGLDPDTGNTQAYMDANALAYMAMALNNNGWFSESSEYVPSQPDGISLPTGLNYPLYMDSNNIYCRDGTYNRYTFLSHNSPSARIVTFYNTNTKTFYMAVISKETFMCGSTTEFEWPPTTLPTVTYNRSAYHSTVNGEDIYYYTLLATSYTNGIQSGDTNSTYNTYTSNKNVFSPFRSEDENLIYVLLYDSVMPSTIDGVSNQPNATLPDTTNWNDLASTLASLQQQYPDMWNNALQYDSIQPNGNVTTTTYVPVPMPEATYNNDPQPTSGNATQQQTQVDPTTSTQTLLQLIADIIQAPQTQTQPQQITPPQNPVDTGTGDTPPIPPITGSASALWTVYHPSQAQVNSFGGWLWSGDIITQIQQILQNPMEGIITLHKVFAPPVDSGNSTIVVGRLDSEVPSATVTQQYVTVDCGSVSLTEQFGNVFDYTNTNVSLYLPFIGIVPLNTYDVMRSTINVTYGVDVFTGACLAMVEVSRDGNTANLYQYSGVCSVEYPLTGSVHSGLINGLLGIAGGMVGIATAGTGVGALAGFGAVASGLASAGHSNNARAGSFSGNAGAMGIKKPYLIIERPQTKVAETYETLQGYPTNYSIRLGDCSGNVVVSNVHINGINATDTELDMIMSQLQDGVII